MKPAGDEETLTLRRADGEVKTVNLDMSSESGAWRVTAMTVKP